MRMANTVGCGVFEY